MLTPSYGLTATERVLPRLSLDFTTALLDPKITFSRTGDTATRVNSSGFIESVAADTARFDFDPVSLLCKGLLIEEARTNQFTYSRDFRDTAAAGSTRPWNYANVTVSADVAVSPDGTQNSDKIQETSATGEHAVYFNNYSASNTTLTVSVFVKADERSKVQLSISDFATGDARCLFDLSAGTAGTASSNTGQYTNPFGSITPYNNGWYRCVLTATKGSANTNNYFVITLNNGSTINYAGTTGYGLFVFGAQLEVGVFATSYIPTVAATVTRNADVAVMTGTNFSDWYSAGAGGVVARVLPSTVSGTRPALQFDNASADEVIALRGNTTNPELIVVDGGALQAQIDAGTIAANTAYNLGAAWDTDNCAAAVNGGAAVTDTTATIPTVTQARFGSDGTNYLNGQIQTVRYWPQRIINAEVQAFSK